MAGRFGRLFGAERGREEERPSRGLCELFETHAGLSTTAE